MLWEEYVKKMQTEAALQDIDIDQQRVLLDYAKNLFDQSLPIIFDQEHLALLIGIDSFYLHAMSNSSHSFYRTFYINKRNGKKRRIDEPLPDLKRVQQWILHEILVHVPCSKYAKAYIPGNTIKHNVRFHRNQETVVALDLKDFFPSIKTGRVLNVFLSLGYSLPLSVYLSELCSLNNKLPQGAPTSPYISNLVMRNFDNEIGNYCVEKRIRFTRYADDLFFSGDFDIARLRNHVDMCLKYTGLCQNKDKVRVMHKGNRQIITGIVVNEKLQVPRDYRSKIRQEIHYIDKFGLDNHLHHIGEQRANYIKHLAGKIGYSLFINPSDSKMKEYLHILEQYMHTETDEK